MRSRTELVTTTFIDSEEDYTDDDDDSEEDWHPTASNKNGKSKTKQQQQQHASGNGSITAASKRGRKRKQGGSTVSGNGVTAVKRRSTINTINFTASEHDENLSDGGEFNTLDNNKDEMAGPSTQRNSTTISNNNLPSKRLWSDKNSSNNISMPQNTNFIEVLIHVKDLMGDYTKNQRLCLWRKDENNLLQKYIRVKAAPDEFLFTSSSVYSSWDGKGSRDFLSIKVQTLDTMNRRIQIKNLDELNKLAQQAREQDKEGDTIQNANNNDITDKSSIHYLDSVRNIEAEQMGKVHRNSANALQKMHQQSTIDDDNDDSYDDDDNDDDDNDNDDNDDDDDESDLEGDDDDNDNDEEDNDNNENDDN